VHNCGIRTDGSGPPATSERRRVATQPERQLTTKLYEVPAVRPQGLTLAEGIDDRHTGRPEVIDIPRGHCQSEIKCRGCQ